jgi:Zn-dependent M28 family amino/carboxypeptidase
MDTVQQTLQAISAAHIHAHIAALEGVRHPVTAPHALERAAVYIKGQLGACGCEVNEQLFEDDGQSYRNILGLHRGARYPGRYVIVMAHYDSESETPGANDNASGVAAMLELARVIQPLPLECSVMFIGVCLEERKLGVDPKDVNLIELNQTILRGSQALVAYIKTNAWDIQGVINLETIASAGDDVVQKSPPGIPFDFPQAGNIIAVVGNEDSKALVTSFINSVQQNQIPLPCVPLVVSGKGEALRDSRRSDHAPFWDAGYRAIMLTDMANFRSPHYHKPSDTLDTLNIPFAVDVSRAAAGLVIEMACLATDR